MPHAALSLDKRYLSFIELPSSSKGLTDAPTECWNRIRGFLFIDRTIEPQSHKTQMAANTPPFKALVNMAVASPRQFKAAQKAFRERVKAWHQEDDEVSFPDHFRGWFEDPALKVSGQQLESVTFGRHTYRKDSRVKIRLRSDDGDSSKTKSSKGPGEYYGTIQRIFVAVPKEKQKPDKTDVPVIVFEEIDLDPSEAAQWTCRANKLAGLLSDKQWSEMIARLKKRKACGVRFCIADKTTAPPPQTVTAGDTITAIAAEAYNAEESTSAQRVTGVERQKQVPAVWLVLYLCLADTRVDVAGYRVKNEVEQDASAKSLPPALQKMKEGGREFVANFALRVAQHQTEHDLYRMKNVKLRHAGVWKFRLVAASGVKPGDEVLKALAGETRTVTVVPATPVQSDACWHKQVESVRVGESLPDIRAFLLDQESNLPQGQPSPELLEKVSVFSKTPQFEVLPGYKKKPQLVGDRGWVLITGLKFRVKPNSKPALPCKLQLEVRLGRVSNQHASTFLPPLDVRAGAPSRLEVVSDAFSASAAPALERQAAISDLKLRVLDREGLRADCPPGEVHVKLAATGATLAQQQLASRAVPAGGELDYGGKLRVTGDYGTAGSLTFAIEGVAGSEISLPFTVAARRLRFVLPDELPEGITRESSGAKRKAPEAGSSGGRPSKRPPALQPRDLDAEAEDAEPGGPLRAAYGAVLSGVCVEVVDEAGAVDWRLKTDKENRDTLELDGDSFAKFLGGRAKLPDIKPWEISGPEVVPGARVQREYRASFAGLTASLTFVLCGEPAERLRPASEDPTEATNRQPATARLVLVGPSGPVCSASFAQTAKLRAALENDGGVLTLVTAPGGLTCTSGPGGALEVSGWEVRGRVDDAPHGAALRLDVEGSEPALPAGRRSVLLPLALAPGPAARFAAVDERGGPLPGPLPVLNGAELPPIAVHAVDADGSLAFSLQGVLALGAAPPLRLAGSAGAAVRFKLDAGVAQLAGVRVSLTDRARLGEAGGLEIALSHQTGPRLRRREEAAAAAVAPGSLRVRVLPNAARPAAVRLLLPPGGLRVEAAASLPPLTAHALGETEQPTEPPAGTSLRLRVGGRSALPLLAEPCGTKCLFLFRGAQAPSAAGEHELRCELAGPNGAADASVEPSVARITVVPGPPHALAAAAADGAARLALRTNARLPDIRVTLTDAHGNARPPLAAGRLVCRSVAAGGSSETSPPPISAPSSPPAWPPGESSVLIAGLVVGEGPGGSYALEIALEGVPLPARLPFDFDSEGEGRELRESRAAVAARLAELDGKLLVARGGLEAAEAELRQAEGALSTARAAAERAGPVPADLDAQIACLRAAVEEARARLEQGGAEAAGGARRPNPLRGSGSNGLRTLVRDRQAGRPPAGLVGLVADLARVDDERMAEALAVFLGTRGQAAIFEEDEHARAAEDNPRYTGLDLLSLSSLTGPALFDGPRDPDGRLRLASPPPAGARYLVNEIAAEPRLRRTLWWWLLRDTVVVDSTAERDRIVQTLWRGRAEKNVVVLPQADARGRPDPRTARVYPRNGFRRAGPPAAPCVAFGSTQTPEEAAARAVAQAEARLRAAEALQAGHAQAGDCLAAAERLRAEVARLRADVRALEAARGELGGERAPRGTTAGSAAGCKRLREAGAGGSSRR